MLNEGHLQHSNLLFSIQHSAFSQPLDHPHSSQQPGISKYESASRNSSHDQKRLGAADHTVGQWGVGSFVREVLAAGEEADEGAAFVGDMVADRAAEDGIRRFQRVEDGALRGAVANIERDFAADAGECSQMRRKLDPDRHHVYVSVWTSTDITGGRSWTMAVQLSPPFADP
jgi:hypothetical protein